MNARTLRRATATALLLAAAPSITSATSRSPSPDETGGSVPPPAGIHPCALSPHYCGDLLLPSTPRWWDWPRRIEPALRDDGSRLDP